MKKITIILIIAISIVSCKDKVKEAETEIRKEYLTNCDSHFRDVARSFYFYYYANPSNYWYKEGTQASEIIDDNFQQGIKCLNELTDIIDNIEPSDRELSSSINTLKQAIEKSKKTLMKAGKLNNDMSLYGGLNAFMMFGNILGSNIDNSEFEKFPKELLQPFEDLQQKIYANNYAFTYLVTSRESEIADLMKLSNEKRIELREKTKVLISEMLKVKYNYTDTICRNEMITSIIEMINTNCPVSKVSTKSEETTPINVKNETTEAEETKEPEDSEIFTVYSSHTTKGTFDIIECSDDYCYFTMFGESNDTITFIVLGSNSRQIMDSYYQKARGTKILVDWQVVTYDNFLGGPDDKIKIIKNIRDI